MDGPNRATTRIEGERVRLVPLGREHLPAIQRWRSDPEVTRYWITQAVPALADLEQWYQRNEASGVLSWAALDEREEPVGYLNLFDIDPENRKAELAIMIGERRVWGQGYARDALRALLRHAVAPRESGGLGLHKVYLAVFADNAAARRVYAACGFREDGMLRDDIFRDGVWHDQILMSVLDRELTSLPAREG